MVRIVDGRRVTEYRSGLVELFGLKTCKVRGIGQVAKLLGARAEVRSTALVGLVKFDEDGADGNVVWQQRRRMKHESGEGGMDISYIHTANTLSHACTRCLYVTQGTCAKKICVRHGVCVHTLSHTL